MKNSGRAYRTCAVTGDKQPMRRLHYSAGAPGTAGWLLLFRSHHWVNTLILSYIASTRIYRKCLWIHRESSFLLSRDFNNAISMNIYPLDNFLYTCSIYESHEKDLFFLITALSLCLCS